MESEVEKEEVMWKKPKEIMSDKSFSIYGEQSITKFVSWPRKKNNINWSLSAHQSIATYILMFSFGLHISVPTRMCTKKLGSVIEKKEGFT